MNLFKEKNYREKRFKELILQPRTLFYLAGIIVLILYHMKFDLSFGDTPDVFAHILKRGSNDFPEDANVFQAIHNFTVSRYHGWSSRSIIEIFLIILSVTPPILWHLMDIGTVILIGYCIDELVSIKDARIKYLSIFSFLMMYYPVHMASAGWIATTLNYSWPMALGLYAYLNIQRIRREEPVSKLSYISALLAALFAMNQEQLCGMMLLFLCVLLVKDMLDKKLKKTILPFFVLNLMEFVYILLCPGNAVRREHEIVNCMPEYANYGIIDKLHEGLCCLLKSLFDPMGMEIITFFCVLLLAYLAFKKHEPAVIKIIALLPLPYVILKSFGGGIFKADYRDHTKATLLGCMILLCIFLVCCFLTRGMEEQIVLLGALCSAAATKIVLGFSVNFRISGERTSIFLAFTLIIAALFLIQKHEALFSFFHNSVFLTCLLIVNAILFIRSYFCPSEAVFYFFIHAIQKISEMI